MLDHTPKWIAVYCFSKSEQLVERRIAEQGIETYLPMWTTKDRRFKQNAPPAVPLFQGYVFAKITAKQIYQTRTVKGVIALVSSNHEVQVIPQREIDAVRAFVEADTMFHLHETAKLKCGAQVAVQSGEFAGMQGRIVRGCKDGNFAVSIEVLHLSFVVKLRRDELTAIDSEPEKKTLRIASIR